MPLFWTTLPGAHLSAFASLFQSLHYLALNRDVDKLTCNEEPVRPLTYLPDGILLTGDLGGLTTWNVPTHKERRHIAAESITCLAVDSAGQVGVTGDNNGTVRLWNLQLGQEMVVAAGPIWPPSEIAVVPGGAKIAIAYQGGPILLWDAGGGESGKPVGAENLSSVIGAISPDGTLAAVRSSGGITIFELASAKKRLTIPTTEKIISALAVSSRSQFLAAAAEDKTILVWSLTDGHLVQRLDGGNAPLRRLLFTPDGKTLSCCSGNDTPQESWDAAIRN